VKEMNISYVEVVPSCTAADSALNLNRSISSALTQSPFFFMPVATTAEIVTSAEASQAHGRVKPSNSKERGFLFLAPAAGTYAINVSVPGNGITSTIEIYSPAGALVSSETLSPSFSTTRYYSPALTKGVVGVKVSASSNNSAGHVNEVHLSSPTYMSWTYPDVPVAYGNHNLADYLPTVGSVYALPLSYPNYPTTPQQLQYPNVGTFTFSDPPNPNLTTNQLPPVLIAGPPIHLYGPPTPEQEAEMYVTSIYLDFEEYAPRIVNTSTRTIYFFLRRKADYTSAYVRLPIDHIVPLN
jgi:hypothetical protein